MQRDRSDGVRALAGQIDLVGTGGIARWWAIGLVAALVSVGLPAARAARAEPPTVIVLSWDGVRHDYPERGSLPGLERMAREGARAERMRPVFPSNTFPAHVTMATGARADRHGILDNAFFDRERGAYDMSADASWIEAEPIWVAAERQGLRAATFFWVGSETDWRGMRATHRVAPFDLEVGEEEKVDRILAWLDLPDDERPALILSWWHGADRIGHLKGPDHPDVFRTLREQDLQLVRLLAGIDARGGWARTTLIVLSDHGMTTVSEAVPVASVLDAAGIEARVVAGSAVAHVFLEEPAQLGAARAALAKRADVTVHEAAGLPAALRLAHPRRTGDLVLLTSPPLTFRAPGFLRGLFIRVTALLGWRSGLHGYAPDHPDMGAIFYALGRGVRAGTALGVVRAIDVAATVSRLLEIDPPKDSEGRPISGVGSEVGSPTASGVGQISHRSPTTLLRNVPRAKSALPTGGCMSNPIDLAGRG